jgi:hypothetical protein
MGKASSSTKVARAARTAGRAGSSRSYAWSAVISVVVVLGIVGIVVSRGNSANAVAPKLGDHWHVAYAIYDCDHFIPSLSDVVQDQSGLHTHADGLMHLHPFGTKYTGTGAIIGSWGETTGLDVSDTSFKAAGIERKNGDKCGSKKGTLQLKAWDSPDDAKGHLIEKDFADYNPQEFTMWTLAFVPEGTEIPKPPEANIEALQAPSDVTGASTTATVSDSTETTSGDGSSTTVPASTETTAPGATPSTEPSTTVPTSSP